MHAGIALGLRGGEGEGAVERAAYVGLGPVGGAQHGAGVGARAAGVLGASVGQVEASGPGRRLVLALYLVSRHVLVCGAAGVRDPPTDSEMTERRLVVQVCLR